MASRRSLIRKIAWIPLSITQRRGSEKRRRVAEKKRRKIGRSENMTWHRSYRSISGRKREWSRPRLRDWVSWLDIGRFSEIRRKYFNRRKHMHTLTQADPFIYERDVDMQHDDTRIARMCRQTGFDIPCLCNYARPVSGRTLIELRCIMIITFDTAMLDTFRIN